MSQAGRTRPFGSDPAERLRLAVRRWQDARAEEDGAFAEAVLAIAEMAPAPVVAEPSPTPRDDRPLLTVGQAAKCLGVSDRKIYSLMDAGEIASVKIGTSRRIRPAELDQYIEGHAADRRGEPAPAEWPKATSRTRRR